MKSVRVTQPLFLSGMMGAGKSTTGRLLAAKIEQPFYDLDTIIEEEEARSIPEIFEEEGESYFRAAEQNLLIKRSQEIKGVMALGGGSLQNQMIVDHLKLTGWLIYLKASASALAKRLESSADRPLLQGRDILQRVETLLDERREFYEQAHITILTDGMDQQKIADEILKKLRMYES